MREEFYIPDQVFFRCVFDWWVFRLFTVLAVYKSRSCRPPVLPQILQSSHHHPHPPPHLFIFLVDLHHKWAIPHDVVSAHNPMALVDERPKTASLLLRRLTHLSRPVVVQEAADCQEQQNKDECPHNYALINDNKRAINLNYSHL